MTAAERLSPQRLCALIDEELEPAARRDMERALATDPDAARRLANWRRNDDALRAAFGIRRAAEAREGDAHPLLPPLGPLRSRDHAGGKSMTILAVAAAFLAGALCTAAGLLLLHMVRMP